MNYSLTVCLAMLGILFCTFAVSASEAERISVRLRTERSRTPIYVDALAADHSDLSEEYLKQIESVLRFDIRHSGTLEIIPPNASRRALLEQAYFGKLRKDREWQQEGVAYVLQWRVEGDQLKVRLNGTMSQASHGIDRVRLTGDLSHDRKGIHLLSDALHKQIFGVPGISSGKILYVSKVPASFSDASSQKEISEVWECDYDGHNPRQVTRGGEFCVTPSYLRPQPGHASSHVFYTSYKTGQPKIYLTPLETWQPQRLSFLSGNQLMPSISPDRTRLAFICDTAGTPDLFQQEFSPRSGLVGKPMQIFSSLYATQATPTFSPDGKHLAFVSDKDGSPRVYVVDVPQAMVQQRAPTPRLLTKRNRENTAPCWSPDGSKIAYAAKTDGIRQIWIYEVERDEEWQLTQGPGHKENPSWAPNSQHLVFNSVRGHSCELYLVNLNQPDAIKISSGPGEKRYPAWDPAWSG